MSVSSWETALLMPVCERETFGLHSTSPALRIMSDLVASYLKTATP